MDDTLFLLVTRSLEAVELRFKSVESCTNSFTSGLISDIRDGVAKGHTGNKGHDCDERPRSSEVRKYSLIERRGEMGRYWSL